MSDDEYGVLATLPDSGSIRYRQGDVDRWPLDEAAAIALDLAERRNADHVSIGNGDHEFRRWNESPSFTGNFNDTPTGLRWADWYVDAEVRARRWVYHPVADMNDFDTAAEIADRAKELLPDVTRIWVGASDGSEEYEHLTADD